MKLLPNIPLPGIIPGMKDSAELFQHLKTGNIYAVKRKWNRELLGSAGPFDHNEIKNVDCIIERRLAVIN